MGGSIKCEGLFCGAIALGIVTWLVAFGLTFISGSVLSVAVRWGLAALALALLIILVWRAFGNSPSAEVAQGVGGIATVIALAVAASIYFLERKDRPRIEFDLTASRALVPAEGAQPRRVLLGVRILVRNSGTRQVDIRCMAIDLFLPEPDSALDRNPGAPEEVLLNRLSQRLDSPKADSRCERTRNPQGQVIGPLYNWPPLRLEPAEADDLYFEFPVDCQFAYVRVLVKMRLRPSEPWAYETKAIIPLREICHEDQSGMAAPVAQSGASVGHDTSGSDLSQ